MKKIMSLFFALLLFPAAAFAQGYDGLIAGDDGGSSSIYAAPEQDANNNGYSGVVPGDAAASVFSGALGVSPTAPSAKASANTEGLGFYGISGSSQTTDAEQAENNRRTQAEQQRLSRQERAQQNADAMRTQTEKLQQRLDAEVQQKIEEQKRIAAQQQAFIKRR